MIPYLDLKKVNDLHHGEISEAVMRVVESGWYLHGKENENFERNYADYIGTDYAIGCGNGLDALYLIFRAYIELGIMKPGDEVIVPANTYIASILAISQNGLIPVLVEPDINTYQIDFSKIEAAISDKTKGMMIVHLYGHNAFTDEIGAICRRHNLKLVEDNAQAHGCRFQGRLTGSLGDAAGHSFYPGKNLGALGDGGAVTTNDKILAQTVRTLANYGSQKKYVFQFLGRNSRLDELQAAVLNAKLPFLDEDNDKRRQIAGRYLREIKNPEIILPKMDIPEENVFHIFPIISKNRDILQKYMRDNGVQTLIHYPIPPHKQECYKEWNSLSYPVTELIHSQELSLPLHPALSTSEVTEIIRLINNFSYK